MQNQKKKGRSEPFMLVKIDECNATNIISFSTNSVHNSD